MLVVHSFVNVMLINIKEVSILMSTWTRSRPALGEQERKPGVPLPHAALTPLAGPADRAPAAPRARLP